MMAIIAMLGVWSWFILGVLLLALEIVVPGTYVLWFGLAAILVGAISLAVDWSWQAQLAAFAVLSIVSLVAGRRVYRRTARDAHDHPFLNRRADALVGRVFTLDKPIVSGSGTVRIDDTVWRIMGPDAAAGSRVKVVRADGPMLVVDPAEA